jgi:hypothetical protein
MSAATVALTGFLWPFAATMWWITQSNTNVDRLRAGRETVWARREQETRP